MRVCVQHERNLEEHAPECLWCELDRVKALLRHCAIELNYLECATPIGRECIEETEKELGEMRYWPEVL